MNKFTSPFMAKSPLRQNNDKKVDPDAPGTPGKPGYEPPVVREELDNKGKKIYDDLRKENAREQYESFSRFEKPEVKKFIDSLKTNDPFNKHIDYIYDSESRRAENKYYSKGEVIKK